MKTQSRWSSWILFIQAQATVFAVYWATLYFGRPASEDAHFYFKNQSIHTFSQLIKMYWNFDEWYRPTQFFVPYFITSRLIGWHQIVVLKCFHLFLYGVLGVLVFRIAMLFCQVPLLSFFALAWWVTHTTNFLPVNNVTGFDSIYQIFSLGFIYYFWNYLQTGKRVSYWLSFLAFTLALTSKEVSVANCGLVAGLLLLSAFWPKVQIRTFPLLKRIANIIPFFVVFEIYWQRYLPILKSGLDEGGYRSKWNWPVMRDNIEHYAIWTPKVWNSFPSSYYYDHPWAFYLAMLAFGLAFLSSIFLFKQQSKVLLLFLFCWIVNYTIVPVYCGGAPWHASLANIGLALWIAVALKPWVTHPKTKRWAAPLLIGVASLTLASESYHFYTYAQNNPTGEMIRLAIKNPPIPESEIHDDEFILINDKVGWGNWTYGVGSLFRWVYLKPTLEQNVIQQVKPEVLKRWLDTPHRHCLEMVESTLTFIDVTQKCENEIRAQKGPVPAVKSSN